MFCHVYCAATGTDVKKVVSKQDIRQQMDQQIEDYLSRGGEVKNIGRGLSGRVNPTAALKPASFSDQPKTERTFVHDVVATLEARKQKPTSKASNKKTKPKARKKIIYDDFGEPMRWEWVED
jgi:hypothetical protein